MAYTVSTPAFEGPIDLLLHLVSSHELDVLDIPLLPVVDAFVRILSEQRDMIDFNQLSEFLLVAAILIELKSQRLLPGREASEDEEGFVGWEERDLLLARLLECRAYAAAADVFVALAEQASRSIPREVGLDDDFVVHAPDLLAGITPDDLAQAYLRGSAERPVPRVDLSHVTVDTVSVSEAVSDLIAVPAGNRAGSFRELVARLPDPDRGDRALPGLARVVQDGTRRAGTGGHLRRPADLVAGRRPTGRGDERPGSRRSWPGTKSMTTRGEEMSPVERAELGRTIEAILLVAVEPLPPQLLAELLEEPVERIEEALADLGQSYEHERRGFVLARIAGGARLQTHPDLAPYVERFANREVSHRLSTAALETLAIVAYRQPVSRGQISALRGVNVDGVTRLLEQRGYIAVVGHAEGPGQPALFGTTDLFLERLGLDSLDQLPAVEDFLPGPEVAGDFERELQSALGLGVEAASDDH